MYFLWLTFFSHSFLLQATLPEKGIGMACFEKNIGQLLMENGDKAQKVLYKAQAPGLIFWLLEDRIIFQTWKEGKDKRSYDLIEVSPKGGQISRSAVVAEDFLPERKQYLDRNAVMNQVPFCEKLSIRQVFPGVDWIFYFDKNKRLKYDFILAPGVSPHEVKIRIRSLQQPFIDHSGRLVMPTRFGDIVEEKPISYCSRQAIATRFQLSVALVKDRFYAHHFESTLGFDFPSNNEKFNDTLVIDPQLTWGSFFGGSATDVPTSMDTDSDGNLYVTGYSSSIDFPRLDPGTPSYFQGTFSGGLFDAFLLKFSPSGVLRWSTYIGASNIDNLYSVVCDQSGNVFVGGSTQSNDFPTKDPGNGAYFQAARVAATEGVILKFDARGECVWSTYLGGIQWDEILGLEIDKFGNLLATGYTQSADFPVKSAFQPVKSNLSESIVMKFSNAGVLQWSTFFGGSTNERAHAVCSDNSGNVFITGYSSGSGLPVLNAFQPAYAGGFEDAFVASYDAAGNLVWATYLGGSDREQGNSIRCDLTGAIWVQGMTQSANFPLQNAFQTAFGGVSDAFLARFNQNGTLSWSTFIGGNGFENNLPSFDNLEADSCNRMYVSFETTSSNIRRISLPCAYNDNSLDGTRDQFLMRFNLNGVPDWATYAGGSANDSRSPLAIDKNGAIYLSGDMFGGPFSASTYPVLNVGNGSYFDDSFNGGVGDFFIARFSPPPLQTSILVNDPTTCGCSGEATVEIQNCSGPPFNFAWSNGSTQQNFAQNRATITNLCPGNYSVAISSTCYSSASVAFTVGAGAGVPPEGSISTPPDLPCSGAAIQLNANSSALGATFSWIGPGLISGSQLSNPLVNKPGLYTVTISDPQSNCSRTVSATVNIETILPQFNLPENICLGTPPSTLPALSLNGISGVWTPAVTDTQRPGVFNYNFIPLSGQCASPLTIKQNILPLPAVIPIEHKD